MDLLLEYGNPVSSRHIWFWNVLNDKVRQAGAEAYAKMAVEAAVKMVKRLETLRGVKPSTCPLEVK